MTEDLPLGPPIRKEPPKVDPDEFKPIPDRPGWFVNGRGQMAREGQVVQPIWPWPNCGGGEHHGLLCVTFAP